MADSSPFSLAGSAPFALVPRTAIDGPDCPAARLAPRVLGGPLAEPALWFSASARWRSIEAATAPITVRQTASMPRVHQRALPPPTLAAACGNTVPCDVVIVDLARGAPAVRRLGALGTAAGGMRGLGAATPMRAGVPSSPAWRLKAALMASQSWKRFRWSLDNARRMMASIPCGSNLFMRDGGIGSSSITLRMTAPASFPVNGFLPVKSS